LTVSETRGAAAIRSRLDNFRSAVAAGRADGGPKLASQVALSWTAAALARPIERMRHERWDRSHGLDTGADGSDYRSHRPDTAALHADSAWYEPMPIGRFSRVVRRLPISDRSAHTFVDFGCGKGAALALAIQHGFGSAVGVELDARLVEVARHNAEVLSGSTSEGGRTSIVHCDAAQFILPATPFVAFFYNPFGAATMSLVLRNIEKSLLESPRSFAIAYANPCVRAVLDDSVLLRRVATKPTWIVYGPNEAFARTISEAERGSQVTR
jgi:SAM-dependent methyltransferase